MSFSTKNSSRCYRNFNRYFSLPETIRDSREYFIFTSVHKKKNGFIIARSIRVNK